MKVTILIFAGFLMRGDVIAANEAEAMDVARKHGGCIACHHPNTKVVGPGWNEITSKYTGQVDIVKVPASRIRKGSRGVWGDLPMPPNTTIPDAEIRTFCILF